MSNAKIFIVDDRLIVAEGIASTLRKLDYEVPEPAMSGEEALERFESVRPDIILMDICLKGKLDGIETAQLIRQRHGHSVIYLTAHSDQCTLQRASATLPVGYLLKPFDERQLYTTIELALNRQREERNVVKQESTVLSHERGMNVPKISAAQATVRADGHLKHIIGNHPALLALLEKAALVAKTDVTVHIYGENGTGKELIADAVHRLSTRSSGPFVKLNCSAIPATLLESALFGHVKGAFTGASRDLQGFVELAEKGTLFLDEIGDLALDIQVKLLRLLQSREYMRVGETALRRTDLRIITATNRDLKQLVREQKMREDFFYRIHVFPLQVPSLHERASDILPLAHHFRALFNRTFNKNVRGFSDAATQTLERYPWPGNIRELENAVRHAFVLVHPEGEIEVAHLPNDIAFAETIPTVGLHASSPFTNLGKPFVSEEEERRRIMEALTQCEGNKTRAAKILGYSRVTLWKRLSRLGLESSKQSCTEEDSAQSDCLK